MKVRIICISKALQYYELGSFVKQLPAGMTVKYIRADDGVRPVAPGKAKFYVVREAESHERPVDAHEMLVEERDILDSVPGVQAGR